MRIAQITQTYSPNGGVGTYVTRLSSLLAAAGHEVAVVHAVPVEKPLAGSPRLFCVENFDQYTGASVSRKRAAEVMQVLAGFKPDVVHIQNNNNFFLEEEIRRNYPCLKSTHVYDFCPAGTKYHHALKTVCGHPTGLVCLPQMLSRRCCKDRNPATLWMFYRRAKAVIENDKKHSLLIAASVYVRDRMLEDGYPIRKLKVIPYFTELPAWNPPEKLEGEKIILATGRMEPEKGIDQLLYAVSYIKALEWKLILDGSGSDIQRLKGLAASLGIEKRVEFAGWLPADQHRALYEKCYLVVVPSVWPEPFGLVGIEAMSYGKPVVAARSGGIPEWMEDGQTGFMVPARDPEAMAQKISVLLRRPGVARAMGESSRKRIERYYEPSRHIEKLLESYQQVIGRKTS